MGFYNLGKLKEEALRTRHRYIPLHELEINGEKQDDEETDYTGDEEETPAEDDTADVDYTAPEEGDAEDDTADGNDTEGGTADTGADGGSGGEAEDGTPATVGAEETPDETDYTIPDDASPETPETAPQDTGDTADVDYTQDDGGDAAGGDATGAEGDTPETTDGSGGSAVNDELKQIEDQLMADLSDEQKQIQSDELRKNFLDLYNVVLDVIDKVNNIHKEESTLQVFEFISSQLLILKDIINTNITRSFDTKTYIENNIDYQHCLAILNSVRMMIDETSKKSQKAKEE